MPAEAKIKSYWRGGCFLLAQLKPRETRFGRGLAMASVIKSRTSLIVLITLMALVLCFQLGTMVGRTGDEAAASAIEERMAQMDQQNREKYPDTSATTDHTPVSSVDRGPVAP